MTKPAKSSFVYVTYIKTTPERVWEGSGTSAPSDAAAVGR